MRNIAVITNDLLLFQKIKLALPSDATATRARSDADVLRLVDVDGGFLPQADELTMSRRDGADIKIPFYIEDVERLFGRGGGAPLSASADKKSAILRGEEIRLTDVEYALFSALMRRRGEFAAREELIDEVWNGSADGGVLNVYIHYLREKLEINGEKIIISSRKLGYKIDEKYVTGVR